MRLSVRDVANLLNVNEKSIYRWIKSGNLPAYRINSHYRFNQAEVLEWATSRKINISIDLSQEFENSTKTLPGLVEAMEAGGIHYRVDGSDKKTVLANFVDVMRLPCDEVNRDFLLQAFLLREQMASTAIGDGIAIPHVRNPIILHITRPMIGLCFLSQPINFGALDGKPVYCLFALISPTVQIHLHLLSRLSYALQDTDLKKVISKQGGRDEILKEFQRVEASILK
jgi:PTS system nitrogen regulatory IIA component